MITRRKFLYWVLVRLARAVDALTHVHAHIEALVLRYVWIARTRNRTDFLKHLIRKHTMNQKDINTAFARWTRSTDNAAILASIETSKPERAALSIDRSDLCPYCKGNMRRTTAAGHFVYVCDSDRHVTPVENDKL